jgi:lipoate-protein ligase A
MNWRLIDSGSLDGYTNMAIDEAMLALRSSNRIPSTLRLYRWSPPAISIGYFQEFKKGNKNIDMVRRLTGGGAILHDKELTYCLVTSPDNPEIPSRVEESYGLINRAIINSLNKLGINACTRGNGNGKKAPAGNEHFFCFARTSKYDIVVDDKKIAGSAQRRTKGALLHHGSILLDDQGVPGSTSVNSRLGRKIEAGELAEKIIEGFKKELQLRFYLSTLTEEEIELAEKLALAHRDFLNSKYFADCRKGLNRNVDFSGLYRRDIRLSQSYS